MLFSLFCAQENHCNSPFDLLKNRKKRYCTNQTITQASPKLPRWQREWTEQRIGIHSTEDGVSAPTSWIPSQGSMTATTFKFVLFNWLTSLDSYKELWKVQRCLVDAQQVPVPIWQWNFRCIPHSCSTSARLFWSIRKENHITCSTISASLFLPGVSPLGTSDLQMKLGDISRDFQWRGNGSVSSWRCGKRWGFPVGHAIY